MPGIQGPGVETLWQLVDSLKPLLSSLPNGLVTEDIHFFNPPQWQTALPPTHHLLKPLSQQPTYANIIGILKWSKFINEINYMSDEVHVLFVLGIFA